MKRERTRLRKILYLVSAAVLLAGSVSAVLIYWSAANDAGDSGYEVVGGFVYPGGGAYDKKYMHDLQLYGGKAAILADEFIRWFNGLWHGTSLAYTVAVITFLTSLIIFIVAKNLHLLEEKEGDGIE